MSRRYPLAAPTRLRIGARTLLIAGLILVVLSGAFLLGLAVVGLLAVGIGGFELARRHSGEKSTIARDGLGATVAKELETAHDALFERALALREANTHVVDSYDDFKRALDAGGFVLAHWDRDEATEARIKEETRATIRCLPFPGQVTGSEEQGVDPVSGRPSSGRVVYARAY